MVVPIKGKCCRTAREHGLDGGYQSGKRPRGREPRGNMSACPVFPSEYGQLQRIPMIARVLTVLLRKRAVDSCGRARKSDDAESSCTASILMQVEKHLNMITQAISNPSLKENEKWRGAPIAAQADKTDAEIITNE